LPIQPFKPWVLIHLLFTAPRYPKSSAKEECFDEEEIDREEDIPPEVECTGTISVQQPLQGIEETQEHVKGDCDNLDHHR
jgi:hypothetical protein